MTVSPARFDTVTDTFLRVPGPGRGAWDERHGDLRKLDGLTPGFASSSAQRPEGSSPR